MAPLDRLTSLIVLIMTGLNLGETLEEAFASGTLEATAEEMDLAPTQQFLSRVASAARSVRSADTAAQRQRRVVRKAV